MPLLPPGPERARARLLALALAATLASGCHKKAEEEEEKQPPVEVHCAAATRAGIDETVVLRGKTATPPGGDLPVAAQVAGRVIETRVKEGDRIHKGAIVAIVDDLAPRAAARQADAALARARSAEVAARAALERAKALADKGIASKREVEDAVARADAARAEVDAGLAGLRLASGTLGRVEVRSSFDGVVTRVWRGAGALVDGTAATPIVQLVSTEAVELVADVTERELWRIKEGQKAEITLSMLGTRLEGTVLARSRALDPVNGLGTVRIRIDGPAKPAADEKKDDDKHDEKKADDSHDDGAAPAPLGAFGKVVIALGHRDGVMVLPLSALRGAVADGSEIAVCKGDKVALRAIEVGYRDDRQIEVLGGLQEGERVATDHVLGLEDDTLIVEAKGDKDDDEHGKGKKGEHEKDDDEKDGKK
jgi:HlyD family secretion protein